MKKITDDEIWLTATELDKDGRWIDGAKWCREKMEEGTKIPRTVIWKYQPYDVTLIQLRHNDGFPFYLTPTEFDHWCNLTHEEKVHEGKEKGDIGTLKDKLAVYRGDTWRITEVGEHIELTRHAILTHDEFKNECKVTDTLFDAISELDKIHQKKDEEPFRQKQDGEKEISELGRKLQAQPWQYASQETELRLLAVQKTNSLEEAEKVLRWLKGETNG